MVRRAPIGHRGRDKLYGESFIKGTEHRAQVQEAANQVASDTLNG